MTTQSFIVYRNPGEEALWNILMSGEFFVVVVAAVAFFVVFCLAEWAMKKLPVYIKHDTRNYIALTVGIIAGLGVGYWLWI